MKGFIHVPNFPENISAGCNGSCMSDFLSCGQELVAIFPCARVVDALIYISNSFYAEVSILGKVERDRAPDEVLPGWPYFSGYS